MPQNSENTKSFTRQYWSFFETLTDDFWATERYVAIDEDNFETFSLEYNRMYQAICSEVDVIAKKLCELLGNPKANNIVQYCETITSHCGDFTKEEVCINRAISIKPWKNWLSISNMQSENPEWWTLYNKVKHNRQSLCTDNQSKWHNKPYYKCATQYNILSALAGLYVLEFYCLLIICKQDCISSDHEANSIYNAMLPIFSSRIFSMPSWYGCHMSFIGEYINKNAIEKKIIEHNITI